MRLFLSRVKIFPLWIFLTVKDFILWIAHKGWTIFDSWGLHLYVSSFGSGKTCSAVRDAYNICCQFPQVSLLTNITVRNFPKHTQIIPLKSISDILNAPRNTVVLIDEIGSIFNSRDYGSKKGGGVPKNLFQRLSQIRKVDVMILATTQHYRYLDIALRRICDTVTVCSAFFGHPFSRMITNRVYKAEEYEIFCDNPLFPLFPISAFSYVQTDKLRALYDTTEIVDTMLGMEDCGAVSADTGNTVSLPSLSDKKAQKDLLNKIRKGGL